MKKVFLIPFLFSGTIAFSQSTINAAGHSTSSEIMQHTYSVGEMTLVHTAKSNNLIVTQGVLQPDEVKQSTFATIASKVNVYPNPTIDEVNLELYLENDAVITYSIFDQSGKMIVTLSSEQIKGLHKMPISLSAFASGNYLLKVNVTQGQLSQVLNYKIQKLN